MLSRIRYQKKGDDILESVRNLKSSSTGAMYYVTLDLIECTYCIKNIVSNRKYRGGDNINNLSVLKRTVKKRLEKLGVKFTKEIRELTIKEEKKDEI